MERFDVALGRCTVRDGSLVIERREPGELGRRDIIREGLAANLEHRRGRVLAFLGAMLGLVVVFGYLLVDSYRANPDAAPLVVGLGLFGLLVVVGSVEGSYRRAMNKRQQFRTALGDEFELVHRQRIPLDAITGVTLRSVSMNVPYVTGTHLLVHFQEDGTELTTGLGFPAFMADELTTARTLFERHDVPVRAE